MSNIKGFHARLGFLIRDLADGKEKDFAKLLEINPENINKWTNRGSLPSAEQLENIARRLNVNINWLLSGEGEAWKPSTEAKPPGPKVELSYQMKPERERKKVFWEGEEISLSEPGKRLKDIRGSLTAKQASELSGVALSTIKDCESGKKLPDVQYLYWAAGYGYTNATWIMTGENPHDERLAGEDKPRYGQPITPEEREIIEMYRTAPKEAKEAVKAILKIYEGRKP
jgi:transcriptional regulator with XRE-family HTH domain